MNVHFILCNYPGEKIGFPDTWAKFTVASFWKNVNKKGSIPHWYFLQLFKNEFVFFLQQTSH